MNGTQLELNYGGSRVFVPQVKAHKENGQWVCDMDLSDSLRFGQTVILSEPGVPVRDLAPFVAKFRIALSDFCDDDFILASGDPALIGIAICTAAEVNKGRVQILRWDRMREDYQLSEVLL